MDDHKKNAGTDEVLAKIVKFSDKYRPIAEELHAIIIKEAPTAEPRLWYGMPGYALSKDGPVVLFFREDKYISFGLTENANVSVDGLTENAWFLTSLDDASKQKIASIIRSIL
jgi:uncharacterized protein YdhG (YjbR/CyaY superfamily)